jgi:hypothetical protein
MASSDTPSFERPAEWWTSERRPGGGGERADIGTVGDGRFRTSVVFGWQQIL